MDLAKQRSWFSAAIFYLYLFLKVTLYYIAIGFLLGLVLELIFRQSDQPELGKLISNEWSGLFALVVQVAIIIKSGIDILKKKNIAITSKKWWLLASTIPLSFVFIGLPAFLIPTYFSMLESRNSIITSTES